jgi:transcriptional regulator with XRE-family HTH domain
MPYPKPDLTLAIVVRSLREQRGVSREALAAEAGITTGSLARTELGYAAPSWDTMQRIAGALGLPLSGLVAAVEARRRVAA